MPFNLNVELIKSDDGEEKMYSYQQELLLEAEQDTSKLINLALLQTLSPYGNYDYAISVLELATRYCKDDRIDIIGYYMSQLWQCKKVGFFKERLLANYKSYMSDNKSLALYLLGYELWQKKQFHKAIALTEESIALYGGHVNNYMLLARLYNNNNNNNQVCGLLEAARKNLQQSCSSCDVQELSDPNYYMNEFISGKTMPLCTFESLASDILCK